MNPDKDPTDNFIMMHGDVLKDINIILDNAMNKVRERLEETELSKPERYGLTMSLLCTSISTMLSAAPPDARRPMWAQMANQIFDAASQEGRVN